MGEPIAVSGCFDLLPEEVLLLIVRKLAKQDPASLVAATDASTAFDRLAPTESPLWKDAFYKQLQASPPCDSPEARALEKEIQGFGGYKGLSAAVKGDSDIASFRSVNLNKDGGSPEVNVETTFLYLMRTLNDGCLLFWGGGTEGETSKRGTLLTSRETRFMVRAQPHPLVGDAEIRELMKGEPYLTFIYKKSTVKFASGRERARVRVWTVPLSLCTYFQATVDWHPLPGRDVNVKTHHICLIYPERHRTELCLCKKMDYGVTLESKHDNVSYCMIIGEIDLKDSANAQNFPIMDLRDWYFGRRLQAGGWQNL